MSAKNDKNKPKLENYLTYGIIFGLVGGAVFSSFGMMFENEFIQVAGYGFGLSIGITVGALMYYFKDKKNGTN